MGAAQAMWDAAKHPRGSHGRFGGGSRVSGGRVSAIRQAAGAPVDTGWSGLGRTTRLAKLRRAATLSHNEKLARRMQNKGRAVTPVDAGMRKARRVMGTHRKGSALGYLPADLHNRWLQVDWSKVSTKGRP